MLELLAIAAEVAEILGVSTELVGKLRNTKADARDVQLLFLRQVVDVSRSWKDVHQKYHSIMDEMGELSVLLDPIVPGIGTRGSPDISSDEIKRALNRPGLVTAYGEFRYSLESSIERIRDTFSDTAEHLDATIRNIKNSPVSRLSDNLMNMRDARRRALAAHQDVCEFLTWGHGNYDATHWNEHRRAELTRFRRTVKTEFGSVIRHSDVALIATLGIYEEFINK